MRILEVVQLATVAIAVFLPVATGRRASRGRVAALMAAAMGAQLVFEGFRWQLVPLEATTVALAVGDALNQERRVRGFPRLRRGALGGLGLAATALLPALLPVPTLPTPTGTFDVGTATFVLTDPEREEVYGLPDPDPDAPEDEEASGRPRRIVVQVWYPAEVPDGAEPAPWNPDIDVVGPAMAGMLGFPGFFLSHTAAVQSHSYLDAPPLDGRFPVVLSSHGWGGFRTINLDQVEALAASGYMVVAPDHAHAAIATRFPDDGAVVYRDDRALPEREEVGEETYQEAAEALVETFTDDLALILDELEAGSLGAFGGLAVHADAEVVGVFGHSTGGGAAVRLCLVDDRCDAVLGLDTWVEPVPAGLIGEELQIPSLFMRSDDWRGTPNDRRLRGLAERSPSLSYWVGIEGAGHNDFLLTPLFSPVAHRLGLKGPIESDRVVPLVEDYLVAFFDRHLLGIGGAALDDPPPSEVDFELIP